MNFSFSVSVPEEIYNSQILLYFCLLVKRVDLIENVETVHIVY